MMGIAGLLVTVVSFRFERERNLLKENGKMNKKYAYLQASVLTATLCIGALLSASKCSRTVILKQKKDAAVVDTETEVNTESDGESYTQTIRNIGTTYDGVDLLVVVDNSGSMAEEQEMLGIALYPLVYRLTYSTEMPENGYYPATENLRIAVITSDMGLQYGAPPSVPGSEVNVTSCEDKDGDNGAFQGMNPNIHSLSIPDGVIPCDDIDSHCPDGFVCITGLCYAENEIDAFDCDTVSNTGAAAVTMSDDYNSNLAHEVACLVQVGTEGCGIEQPLEAAVRAVQENAAFFNNPHYLFAVLIVSDEEDCSIENPALFETEEWQSGPSEMLNVACNLNDENSANLFDSYHVLEALTEVKNGDSTSIIFGAVVGVPPEEVCQGRGSDLFDCLNQEEMQLVVTECETPDGNIYNHFRPACERLDDNGITLTSAKPGRRFVETAMMFGDNGFVTSICNEDWTVWMSEFTEIVSAKLHQPCPPIELETVLSPTQGCDDCTVVSDDCELFVEYNREIGSTASCPITLLASVDDEEQARLEGLIHKEVLYGSDDTPTMEILFCPLPKIPIPLDTTKMTSSYRDYLLEQIGWWYSESTNIAVDRCSHTISLSIAAQALTSNKFVDLKCK
jgi:hypothetical protein